MFKKKHCSPSNKNNKGSCLNRPLLEKVAKVVSNLDECGRIDCSITCEKILHKNICKELKKISDCDNEVCWMTIKELMDSLSSKERDDFKFSFKPVMPESWKKEPNKWLNTLDIDNVLEQYEDAFEKFKYFGATPIDFDKEDLSGKCSVNELCDVDIKELLDDGYESFGAVFNTDDSNGPGEHWFSVYVDLKGVNRKNKPGFYYFDSVGTSAPDEIKELVEELLGQSRELVSKKDKRIPKELEILYNDIQHQYGNTECGVYSLHFLTEMLKGKNFKRYIKKKRSDKEMEKFRKIFFIEI